MVGSVDPLTVTLGEYPPAAYSARTPSPTALPEASRAVTVTVTFSPAVGATGENVTVTVLAVRAPTRTVTEDVIVAAVQAEVSQSLIVAVPDLTPVTVSVDDGPAETVATVVSDYTA